MQLSPNNYLIIAIFPTFSQLAGIHMIKKYTRGDIQSVPGQHIPDEGAVTYIVLAVANQLTHKLTTNVENPNRPVRRQVDKKQFTWAAAVAAGIQRFPGIPHHIWIGHNPDQIKIDLFRQDTHASGGEFIHIICKEGAILFNHQCFTGLRISLCPISALCCVQFDAPGDDQRIDFVRIKKDNFICSRTFCKTGKPVFLTRKSFSHMANCTGSPVCNLVVLKFISRESTLHVLAIFVSPKVKSRAVVNSLFSVSLSVAIRSLCVIAHAIECILKLIL